MSDKKQIKIPVIFYANSVNKNEYRDPKVGIENSYNISFIDNTKKDKKDNDWTPVSSLSLTIVNGQMPNLIFGKKYNILFEEIE